MAFRVPPSQAPRRQTSYSFPQQSPALDFPSPFSQFPDDESTQWVLFSPSQDASDTAHTRSASTERTQRTAGPSRLSDFGSFGTPTGLESTEDDNDEEILNESLDEEEEKEEEEEEEEDGTELDSLDDGLHAFPELPVPQTASIRWDQGAPAVLPAHDGLGSFLASSQSVQEQLWQHEQFNPRRRPDLRPRRPSAIQRQLDTVAESEETSAERERWKRIEKWRIEQSLALLHEIERETRRRRRRNSHTSRANDRVVARSVVTESLHDIPETPKDGTSSPQGESQEYESFWQRITRKVIRDLIGIDDSLLSVILGESLPEEEEEEEMARGKHQHDSNNADSESDGPLDMDAMMKQELDFVHNDDQQLWQTKFIQRIARELGILINRFVEHPGAFSSYLQLSDGISNEYAGMPLSRLAEKDTSHTHFTSDAPTTSSADSTNNLASMPSPHFTPTLRDPSGTEHESHWGIEDEDDPHRTSTTEDPLSESAHLQQEQEYWERELDVMMVFRYLRNRFSRGGNNNNTNNSNTNNNTSSATTTRSYTLQDPSRRAAIIRQHHPLVARAHSRSQSQIHRQVQLQYSTQLSAQSGVSRQRLRRASSGCASQSARLSAISSKRALTGSSRNYWDIGGSVESGSAIGPVAAGVGTWGDI